MEDDSNFTLTVIALSFGVVSTVCCVVITIGCCVLWLSTRKQLRALKCQVERGKTNNSYEDPNVVPLQSDPLQSDASESPDLTNTHPAVAAAVADASRGYLNKLSMLPDDMRTPDYLEGETVPKDLEGDLLEKYKKERSDYEKQQLLKMAELKAKRQAQQQAQQQAPAQSPAAVEVGGCGYEEVNLLPPAKAAVAPTKAAGGQSGMDPYLALGATSRVGGGISPYEFPADALPHAQPPAAPKQGKGGGAKKASQKGSQRGPQQMMVADVGGKYTYTPVFNTLPKGPGSPPAPQNQRGRALSASSPTARTTPTATTPTYENSPWPSPKKTPEHSPKKTPEHSNPSPKHSPENAKQEASGRADSNRQSKRKVTKEVVEFDPNKPRKFRMLGSNARRNSSGEEERRDQTDGALEQQQRRGSMQLGERGLVLSSPTSPTSTGGASARPFSLHAEDAGGQLSYAMVNMEDKKTRRVGGSNIKVEGSGPPQHYRVPIASS